MRVKNPNMAGQALRLRFAEKRVEFDDAGEAEVPAKDGKFLCATPGWSEVGAKAPRPPAEPPKPPPLPPPAPEPEAAPTAREADETTKVKTPPAKEADDEEEGPDLDSMTRKQLLEVAEQYEVDVSDMKRATVTELRAHLDDAIFGEED